MPVGLRRSIGGLKTENCPSEAGAPLAQKLRSEFYALDFIISSLPSTPEDETVLGFRYRVA
jgi:hypothetical protein